MAASLKPATAPAVTRALVAAGMQKCERHTTAVRGYNTFTAGVTSENEVDTTSTRVRRGSYSDGSPRMCWERTNHKTGVVIVDYVCGRSADRLSSEERDALVVGTLERAAEILEGKGFTVERQRRGEARIVLVVSRRDAEGNVIR